MLFVIALWIEIKELTQRKWNTKLVNPFVFCFLQSYNTKQSKSIFWKIGKNNHCSRADIWYTKFQLGLNFYWNHSKWSFRIEDANRTQAINLETVTLFEGSFFSSGRISIFKPQIFLLQMYETKNSLLSFLYLSSIAMKHLKKNKMLWSLKYTNTLGH